MALEYLSKYRICFPLSKREGQREYSIQDCMWSGGESFGYHSTYGFPPTQAKIKEKEPQFERIIIQTLLKAFTEKVK